MAYTNSSLVDFTQLSPNHSGSRTHTIDRITPHCYVGQVTVERMGSGWAKPGNVSANYGIALDGKVGLYVEEKNRAWTSSSNDNDQRAITIECACDTKKPYAFNDVVYDTLIDLCTDICKRNGKTKLLWFDDKAKTLNYKQATDEMVITVHRWFANKDCPGDWLYSRLDELADEVTKRLAMNNGVDIEKPEAEKQEPVKKARYIVQVGAYSELSNAENMKAKLTAAGFDSVIVEVDNNDTSEDGAWVPKVDDIVYFDGDKHYGSANATNGYACSKGKARITKIYKLGKSKHPYHLVRVNGPGPYGWVDAGTFTKI